jgi:hypothetical protein
MGGPCAVRTRINGHNHAALVYEANSITVRLDPLRIVEILKIAYVTTLKSRKTSRNKEGQEVRLYMSKIS